MTAGDGTNDVLVSLCVDTGTVTGVGIDAVTDRVDAAPIKNLSRDVASVTSSLCVITARTK